MDAANLTHANVEVALHRDEAQGLYLFGVVVNGEFVPLLSHKLGRIDKHIARGAQRQSEQASAQPAPADTTPTQQ